MTRPLCAFRQSPISVKNSLNPYSILIPVLRPDQLVSAILDNKPDTMIQFYLTWGRPYGEQTLCESMEQFCSYESMQAALTSRYTSFACLNKPARLAPVGEAFRSSSCGGDGVVDVNISGG